MVESNINSVKVLLVWRKVWLFLMGMRRVVLLLLGLVVGFLLFFVSFFHVSDFILNVVGYRLLQIILFLWGFR